MSKHRENLVDLIAVNEARIEEIKQQQSRIGLSSDGTMNEEILYLREEISSLKAELKQYDNDPEAYEAAIYTPPSGVSLPWGWIAGGVIVIVILLLFIL
ncbi:MAG: hypothetical protein AAF485_00655 [Chloroflexota bacterium]